MLRGTYRLNSTRTERLGVITVRILGADTGTLWANANALNAAFRQDSYSTYVTILGQTETWAECGPAERVMDQNAWNKFHLAAHQIVYSYTVPHRPISGVVV